ncbi:MAG TPA: RNA-binding transcriptional accessory protein, partial [Polyangiaceae bacterium]|nr:RNA-binding transcriptional accessory protein [Polyangiaceae bacterium]
VVKVGDKVKVKVVEVDLPRKRIALTARSGAVQGQRPGGGAVGGGGGGARGPQGRPDTRGDRGHRPAPKAPEQPKFANNPFAQAFGKPRG